MFADQQQWIDKISSSNIGNSDELFLEVFRFQYQNCKIYHEYCYHIGVSDPAAIQAIAEIPFLPVEFFKSHRVVSGSGDAELVFSSSATGGRGQSRHYVSNRRIYEDSFVRCFEQHFGSTGRYCFLALLPSYLEREGSSLIYMVDHLAKLSTHPLSGFFLYEYQVLKQRIMQLEKMQQPYIVFGVSFALLDFAEQAPVELKSGLLIETGGMKGRKKEITRMEVLAQLKKGLNTDNIYSEYGMTELLSQAYAGIDGLYEGPAWMRVLISDPNDPFTYAAIGKTGLINVIDLANINSCCFIRTSDLGRLHANGKFEVLGRLDHSDLRGCSLLI